MFTALLSTRGPRIRRDPSRDLGVWIEDLDQDSPARQLRLGFDTQGRLLETVVLVFDSGNELVIPP